MTGRLHCTPGTLHEHRGETAFVPIVRAGTPLIDVTQLMAGEESRQVLVQNADGGLLGIVTAEDIQNAIRDHEGHGSGWHHRCVESLLHLTLVETASDSCEVRTPTANPACVSVRDGVDLVAVLTEEDVLLSWARLSPALQRTSLDPLTQLPNRAWFERRFQEEWQRASRQGTSLGLLIIDVDHFKQINDQFGHPRGDLVLASVAACCQRQLRTYDVIARYAGDEFIALTSGCSVRDIELPVRRLHQATRELDLEFSGQTIPVTLSIGAAVITDASGPLTAASLIEAADQSLYFAKRQGRDRAFRTELLPDGSIRPPQRVDAEHASLSVE